jgi:hypothetical protein
MNPSWPLKYDSSLQNVAFGTIFSTCPRSGAILFMALDALLMKRIGPLENVRGFDFGSISVTIKAGLGVFADLLPRGVAQTTGYRFDLFAEMGVVAIHAIECVSVYGGMGLMIEENFAGIGLIHQADRLGGFLDGECGVTDNGDEQ